MKKYLVLLIFCLSLLQADEISVLIAKIKTAQPSQKRVLINQLKHKLRYAKSHTRNEVLTNLRGTHQHQNQHKRSHPSKMHTKSDIKIQQNRHKKHR